jgi:hypothetical protein
MLGRRNGRELDCRDAESRQRVFSPQDHDHTIDAVVSQVTIYEKLGFTKRGELDVVGPFDLGTAKLYCFEKPA